MTRILLALELLAYAALAVVASFLIAGVVYLLATVAMPKDAAATIASWTWGAGFTLLLAIGRPMASRPARWLR